MNRSFAIWFFVLTALMLLLATLSVSLGSVEIDFGYIFKFIISGDGDNESWNKIIGIFRVPKMITAICVGLGLSGAGLAMQSYFRNPLAGPYVLGISSGASLGVAIYVLMGTSFGWWLVESNIGVVGSALLGSLTVIFTILMFARKVTSMVSLLIMGIMFSSAISAVVSIMQYFSSSDNLQSFVFWTMGSLSAVSNERIWYLIIPVLLGWVLLFTHQKSLNAIMLGEEYARSIGINTKRLRYVMVVGTSLLAGTITAFCGPIAFIGISVPHMARMLVKSSNHLLLFPLSALIGINLLLVCDIVAQIPGASLTLPINAITSIFGAPIVIWVILNYQKRA